MRPAQSELSTMVVTVIKSHQCWLHRKVKGMEGRQSPGLGSKRCGLQLYCRTLPLCVLLGKSLLCWECHFPHLRKGKEIPAKFL